MSVVLSAFAVQAVAYEPPGVHCDGVYCREVEDREWHVRIVGEVISPAGIYVVISGVDSKVIFRSRIPKARYPAESPYKIKVGKDGIASDYLVTIFGTQADYGSIQTPYTDLPYEVYGKEADGRTFLHVIPQGASRNIPYGANAPGGLYFQVEPNAEEVTFEQGDIPWTIHDADGNMIYNARDKGRSEFIKSNGRTKWIGTFKGTPGKTYILGHALYWFYAKPRLYVAATPDRWFVPDPHLELQLTWWRQKP